jgi:hypothetical protein
MDAYRELSAPRVGQAVTAFIAKEFAGDRRKAERESVRRVARALGISDLRRWSADEITGFQRMAHGGTISDSGPPSGYEPCGGGVPRSIHGRTAGSRDRTSMSGRVPVPRS